LAAREPSLTSRETRKPQATRKIVQSVLAVDVKQDEEVEKEEPKDEVDDNVHVDAVKADDGKGVEPEKARAGGGTACSGNGKRNSPSSSGCNCGRADNCSSGDATGGETQAWNQ